jgi:hypothetical protein
VKPSTTISLSRVKAIDSLDEYRAFLQTFNWFHDGEKDFSAWATAKNELMYIREMANLSSDLFKHEFNLYYCAFYGVSAAAAPFRVRQSQDQTAAVTQAEVEKLQERLGLPKLRKTKEEPWR